MMNLSTCLPQLDSLGFVFIRTHMSILWQSSIIISIALITELLLLKNSRASLRHQVIVYALIIMPFIPVLNFFTTLLGSPRVAIPLIPEYGRSAVGAIVPHQLEAAVYEYFLAERSLNAGLSGIVNSNPWLSISFLILAVTLLFFIGVLIGRIRLNRWISKSRNVTDSEVLEIFEHAAQKLNLNRKFYLIVNDSVSVPFTKGAVFPLIVLPSNLIQKLDKESLTFIALHELSHVQRYDAFIFTLVTWIRAVFFFNPLVWLASFRITSLAEQACDEQVLDSTHKPLVYAKMLTSLASSIPQIDIKVNMAAGFIFSRKIFIKRIKAILTRNETNMKKTTFTQIFAIILTGSLSVTTAISLPLGMVLPQTETILMQQEGGGARGKTVSSIKVPQNMEIYMPAILPLYSNISQRTRMIKNPITGKEQFHEGLDIVGEIGDDVKATQNGTVFSITEDKGYGKKIVLDHGHGITTVYAHLSEFKVKMGQEVKAGQVIGAVGNTGLSTGPHLHYALKYNNEVVDPINYLDEKSKQFVIDNQKKKNKKARAGTCSFFEVDNPPEIVGGVKALNRYLMDNNLFPEKARKQGISGVAIIDFVVNEEGKATDFEVVKEKPSGYGFSDAGIEALKGIEFTIPKHQGKTVKVEMRQSFNFNLDNPIQEVIQ